MEDNLSIDDLKLRLGSFADEKETMRILKENNLLESINPVINLNPEDKNSLASDRGTLIDKQDYKFYRDLNNSLFGNNLVQNLKHVYQEDQFKLITNISEIDNFLCGGFRKGRIYEIQGPSLSGKSHLLNKLLIENYSPSQGNILFIDTNHSLYENTFKKIQHIHGVKNIYEIKKSITVINSISELKELNAILKSLSKFNFILIDSLSLLLSDEGKYTEDLFEFCNLIKKLVRKNNIGVIYTINVNTITEDESKFFDKRNNISYAFGALDIGENSMSTLHTDYVLTFYIEGYWLNIQNYKERSIFLVIKKANGNYRDTMIQVK